MSTLRRFNARLEGDRKFATWFYGVLTVVWALLGIDGLGGWRLVLHVFVVGCFGFVFVSNLIRWRRDGRWVGCREPIGPLSPELRVELQRLVDAGHSIDAIKLVRKQTGVDLADAKQIVDGLDCATTPKRSGDR